MASYTQIRPQRCNEIEDEREPGCLNGMFSHKLPAAAGESIIRKVAFLLPGISYFIGYCSAYDLQIVHVQNSHSDLSRKREELKRRKAIPGGAPLQCDYGDCNEEIKPKTVCCACCAAPGLMWLGFKTRPILSIILFAMGALPFLMFMAGFITAFNENQVVCIKCVNKTPTTSV